MKRTRATNQNKIPHVFRLRPDLAEKLIKESVKTNINKTRIVELALGQFFAIKR